MVDNMIVLNETTYETTLLGGDKVEIGDRDSIDFKPHIKLNRWDGECFIKVELPTIAKKTPIIEGDKVKWANQDLEANFYPLEPRTVIAKDKEGKDHSFKQCELGGFEFEVILKKKPAKNTIVLDIETQGLKFYYQPELTQQEIDEGCIRPDNVIGSYAVYHATRTPMHRSKADAEKYRCGKAFHIYRPKIADAEGKWAWGELSIDDSTLTTTIPQEFLDKAIYPVSTGTTNFGYSVGRGATITSIKNYISGGVYTCPAVGTGVSITVWLYVTSAAKNTKCALYDNAAPANLIDNGVTEEINVPIQDNWQTFNFISAPTLANQAYRIEAWSQLAAGDGCITYDTITGETANYVSKTYNGFPSSVTFTNSANKRVSIYCTYEAGGAGWTGKISGVTNPAKIAGVAVANIQSVKGVA